MPAKVTCSCGASLTVNDDAAAKKATCPRCGNAISLSRTAIKRLDNPAGSGPPPLPGQSASARAAVPQSGAPHTGSPQTGIVKPPKVATAASREQLSEESEDEEIEDEEIDVQLPEKPRKKKGRRRGLAQVNLGLAFHYFLPFVFLIGTGSGLLATVLDIGVNTFEFEANEEPANFFFFSAGLFMLLTGVIAVPAAALGLLGAPEEAGRGPVTISLGLLFASFLPAAILLFLDHHQWLFFVIGFGALFTAWTFWMGFLNELGKELHQNNLAKEVRRAIVKGIVTAISGFSVVLLGGFLVLAVIQAPYILYFVSPAVLAAILTILFKLGQFDGFFSFFFGPSGIPFALEYANFIGGIRMVILRRT